MPKKKTQTHVWNTLSGLQKLSLVALVLLVISLPIAVLSIAQETKIKSEAADPSRFLQRDQLQEVSGAIIPVGETKSVPKAKPGCVISGCSGEICQNSGDEPIMTTCQYKESYACYKQHGACEIQTNGNCGWTQTLALQQCLGQITQDAIPSEQVFGTSVDIEEELALDEFDQELENMLYELEDELGELEDETETTTTNTTTSTLPVNTYAETDQSYYAEPILEEGDAKHYQAMENQVVRDLPNRNSKLQQTNKPVESLDSQPVQKIPSERYPETPNTYHQQVQEEKEYVPTPVYPKEKPGFFGWLMSLFGF